MRRHVGNPVSGERFWPRPDLLEPLVESIHARQESQKLFGLRRIGKSSLMKECALRLERLGWVTVEINAEDFGGVESLFSGLLSKIQDRSLKARVLNAFEQNKYLPSQLLECALALLRPGPAPAQQDFGPPVRAYWSVLAAVIGDAIRGSDKPVVLFLDELPFMLQNMLARGAPREELESLLAGLRSWRQDAGLVMVLSGSLGLGWVMREQRLPSVLFNNLNSLAITPLSAGEARAMLDGILACEPVDWWTEAATECLLDQLGRHALYPIFVQVAFDKVKQARAATPDAVALAFKEKVELDLVSNFYKQFKDRLRRYDAPAQAGAHAVLSGLSQARDEALDLELAAALVAEAAPGLDPDELLDILAEDGFIRVDHAQQTARPSSPLVSAWWRIQRPRRPKASPP
jgi:hypothetical protein